MARIDEQKEIVTFWRSLLFLFIGIFVTILGFTFNNFEKFSQMKMILIEISGISVIIGIIFSAIKLKQSIRKLRKL